MPFSVVILTLNEERDLPGCLASIRGCDDIVILDSGSTDRTLEIAKAAGARSAYRKFDNFGGQRNFAQSEIQFHHPWVFHLDADEHFTPELLAECERQSQREDIDGFYVAPKMLWEGRWIPHCTDFPAWQARFVRAPQFRFIAVGHGQREAPEMRLERLTANYTHNLSSGGTDDWLAKHKRYAAEEARNHLQQASGGTLAGLFSSEKLVRRRALKRLSYSFPFRPALRFLYQYVLRGGILDGPQGYRYCLLLARYEGFTSAEIRRLRKASS